MKVARAFSWELLSQLKHQDLLRKRGPLVFTCNRLALGRLRVRRRLSCTSRSTWCSPTDPSPCPRATALDRYGLQKAGFTHVLNAAHGRWNVNTGPDYYRDMAIEYHGVEADDVPSFDLSVFFHSAAAFIDSALRDDHSKRHSPPVPCPGPLPSTRLTPHPSGTASRHRTSPLAETPAPALPRHIRTHNSGERPCLQT